MRRWREGQPPSRAERQRWLAGTAEVLYARAYALYVARRRAGIACQLCGHAGVRAAIGDHRLIEGPHQGTCGLRCYVRRVDVDYRIAALGLDGGVPPCLYEASRRAVSRRLLALMETYGAAGGGRRCAGTGAGDGDSVASHRTLAPVSPARAGRAA